MSSLRQDDTDKAKDKYTPDVLKSDERKVGDQTAGAVDHIASYIPGQDKPRDHLSSSAHSGGITHDEGRLGGTAAFKPSGEQTVGETAKTKLDQVASAVQPNDTKSTGQQVRDASTPGNQVHADGQGVGAGIVNAVTDAAVGAKNVAVGATTAVTDMMGGTGSKHEER